MPRTRPYARTAQRHSQKGRISTSLLIRRPEKSLRQHRQTHTLQRTPVHSHMPPIPTPHTGNLQQRGKHHTGRQHNLPTVPNQERSQTRSTIIPYAVQCHTPSADRPTAQIRMRLQAPQPTKNQLPVLRRRSSTDSSDKKRPPKTVRDNRTMGTRLQARNQSRKNAVRNLQQIRKQHHTPSRTRYQVKTSVHLPRNLQPRKQQPTTPKDTS
jgi:hypothetical protein